MKKLLPLILILISFTLSAQWTVREDTLISNLGDTLIERWEGLQTPYPEGILLELKYNKYFLNNGIEVLVQREKVNVARRDSDTVGNNGNTTILWLKDQTFVNRNYIKMWAEWEIEKWLEQQRAIPETEPEP